MKIRLHGTEDECREVAERLAGVVDVLSVSEPYRDRGASVLVRVYVEVRRELASPNVVQFPARPAQTTMQRDAALVLDALTFAAEARRERVDQPCGDCEMDRMCESHAADIDRADEYDHLADRIREQTS